MYLQQMRSDGRQEKVSHLIRGETQRGTAIGCIIMFSVQIANTFVLAVSPYRVLVISLRKPPPPTYVFVLNTKFFEFGLLPFESPTRRELSYTRSFQEIPKPP
eukprot:Gregarina_sp_Poly_1__2807@NODE_1780_length_3344_cov_71_803784_g1158_i0_p4_GENE_NODE_1780_length_3344_cov_71_803784_g1158_i0NODE_1780_length_3344_cov_71_803784_g1158_i0_p4_ORF_typecomplete_len103_score5_96_NODE_1780_length_3344_cov_71_803784_g1158_i0259567